MVAMHVPIHSETGIVAPTSHHQQRTPNTLHQHSNDNLTPVPSKMKPRLRPAWSLLALVLFSGIASASLGDRLPEFKDCVKVPSPLCPPLHWSSHLTPLPTGLRNSQLRHRHSDAYPTAPPPAPLDMSRRMRLHMPAHRDSSAARPRPTIHEPCAAIPREMAILPVHGHARAL